MKKKNSLIQAIIRGNRALTFFRRCCCYMFWRELFHMPTEDTLNESSASTKKQQSSFFLYPLLETNEIILHFYLQIHWLYLNGDPMNIQTFVFKWIYSGSQLIEIPVWKSPRFEQNVWIIRIALNTHRVLVIWNIINVCFEISSTLKTNNNGCLIILVVCSIVDYENGKRIHQSDTLPSFSWLAGCMFVCVFCAHHSLEHSKMTVYVYV